MRLSSLPTASVLKGTGASRDMIVSAKKAWRGVEMDPNASKNNVKRARIEQSRIANLLKSTPVALKPMSEFTVRPLSLDNTTPMARTAAKVNDIAARIFGFGKHTQLNIFQ